jgi:hypothetical protein
MVAPGALVHAYDIASTTGWAEGTVADLRGGARPRSGSHRFAPVGATRANVLANAMTWFADRLAIPPRPAAIFIEAPDFFDLGGGKKNGVNRTSMETVKLLLGLATLVECVAYKRGVYDVQWVSSASVRRVFLGSGKLKGDVAKREAVLKCRALGWEPSDDNAADALALLVYGFEKLWPGSTERTLPLFIGGKLCKQVSPLEP